MSDLLLCTPGLGPTPAAHFLTRFCLTLDETGRVATIPRWQYVLEYVEALEGGGDVHVEKTRQMMATWVSCAYFLWAIMFRSGFSGFMASRKERLVDDGGENSTINSLFGRIRFLYGGLPEWLRSAVPVRFTHLRIDCPSRQSFVVGEAANGEIGRGGSYTQALIDEAAMLERSEASHRSIRLACPRGLIYQSTPNGRGNAFARIRFEMPGEFSFLREHWTRHPGRFSGDRDPATGRPTSEWYRRMAASMTRDQIARELDIDYSASVSGLVYPEFDEDRHVSPDVAYAPELDLCVSMDFGIGAETAAVFFQVHGEEMWCLDDYGLQNGDVSDHAPSIWGKARRLGFAGEKADLRFFGDPAGNAREMTRKDSTVIRAYRGFGFTNFVTPRYRVKDGIRLVKRKFHQGKLYVHPRCSLIRSRIPDYQYRTDDAGNVLVEEPIHNHASHVMDALRYGATGVFRIDDGVVLGSLDLGAGQRPKIAALQNETYQSRDRSAFRPVVSVKREF